MFARRYIGQKEHAKLVSGKKCAFRKIMEIIAKTNIILKHVYISNNLSKYKERKKKQ
jgi:hypothetical protein